MEKKLPMPSPAAQHTMKQLYVGMKEIMDTVLQKELNSARMVLAVLPPLDDADKIFWSQITPSAQKRILAGAVHDYILILKRQIAELPPPEPGVDY